MVERTPHSSVRAIHRAVAALSDRTGRFQAGAPSQGQDDAAADVVVAATMTRQQKTAAIAGIVALSADASLFLCCRADPSGSFLCKDRVYDSKR